MASFLVKFSVKKQITVNVKKRENLSKYLCFLYSEIFQLNKSTQTGLSLGLHLIMQLNCVVRATFWFFIFLQMIFDKKDNSNNVVCGRVLHLSRNLVHC